jgi:hypothetical protein
VAYRTEAHDTDTARNGAESSAPSRTGKHPGAGTGLRSGASRERLAPFAPYEREYRQVLAEMALLQYGKTQSFNGSGAKSENPDPRPSGEAHPMHEYWAERWTLESVTGRGALLTDAREALRAWKVRVAPLETDGSSEDDWIIRDGKGFPPDDVARSFKTTASRVRNLRKAKRLDTETGFPQGDVVALVSDEQRIRNLSSQGCTERQIAFQVGVSKSTVRRALGRAA